MSDWIGNATSIYATHGASNHSDSDRAELDYYATDPEAVEMLLDVELFNHYIVVSSDIVNRGSEYQTGVEDFLKFNPKPRNSRDIITNPPYKFAAEFAEHALDISQESVKVAMFLKLTFLEGAKRKRLFDKYPPQENLCFPKSCGLLEKWNQAGQTFKGCLLCVVCLGKGLPWQAANFVDMRCKQWEK